MMFRYWRIQFSLICCALLLTTLSMWVRSYYIADIWNTGYNYDHSLRMYSVRGLLMIGKHDYCNDWGWGTGPTSELSDWLDNTIQWSTESPFLRISTATGASMPWLVAVPYWVPTILIGAVIGLSWYGRIVRFSLLTLVMLTTIVAILLGVLSLVSSSI
jgi:hypothetical protein